MRCRQSPKRIPPRRPADRGVSSLNQLAAAATTTLCSASSRQSYNDSAMGQSLTPCAALTPANVLSVTSTDWLERAPPDTLARHSLKRLSATNTVVLAKTAPPLPVEVLASRTTVPRSVIVVAAQTPPPSLGAVTLKSSQNASRAVPPLLQTAPPLLATDSESVKLLYDASTLSVAKMEPPCGVNKQKQTVRRTRPRAQTPRRSHRSGCTRTHRETAAAAAE